MSGTITMSRDRTTDPAATLVERARQHDQDAAMDLIRRCARRIAAGIEIAGVGRHEADFDDAQNQASQVEISGTFSVTFPPAE